MTIQKKLINYQKNANNAVWIFQKEAKRLCEEFLKHDKNANEILESEEFKKDLELIKNSDLVDGIFANMDNIEFANVIYYEFLVPHYRNHFFGALPAKLWLNELYKRLQRRDENGNQI